MEAAVFSGILNEISMKAQLLREKIKNNPDSIKEIIYKIDILENDFFESLNNFNETHK